MTAAYTVPCANCDAPAEPDWYGHVCDDCNVILPRDLDPTWTTLGDPCAKGHPTCWLGDGHARECAVKG